MQVIVEKNNFARSEAFLPVRIEGEVTEGELITVNVDAVDEGQFTLLGKCVR